MRSIARASLVLLILALPIFIIPANGAVTIIPSTNPAPIDSNTAIDSGLSLGFNGAYPAGAPGTSEAGLCFVVSSMMTLKQVKFNMVVFAGSPLGTLNALLFASTGTFGTNCQPTGSSLATSTSLVIGSINGDTPFFVFSSYFVLQAGTTYAVSIRLISCVICNSSNYWSLKYVGLDASITSNIYTWNNPYATVGPHYKLKYEIDGLSIIRLKNQYGYLDVTSTGVFNSFTVYANGTMFFDYTGQTGITGSYTFQTTSYGNGTLQLRFKGEAPGQVLQSAATSSYVNGRQQITYTANQSSPLSLSFLAVNISLINSALMLALFLPAALIGLSLKLFLKPGQKAMLGSETPKSYFRKAIVLIIIVFILSLVALIVR